MGVGTLVATMLGGAVSGSPSGALRFPLFDIAVVPVRVRIGYVYLINLRA